MRILYPLFPQVPSHPHSKQMWLQHYKHVTSLWTMWSIGQSLGNLLSQICDLRSAWSLQYTTQQTATVGTFAWMAPEVGFNNITLWLQQFQLFTINHLVDYTLKNLMICTVTLLNALFSKIMHTLDEDQWLFQVSENSKLFRLEFAMYWVR